MDLGEAFEGFLTIIGLAIFAAGLVFLYCIIGTAIGALTGWFVHITPLGRLVERGLQVFGFNATGFLPHIGAMFGFITGFFKGIVEIKKKD